MIQVDGLFEDVLVMFREFVVVYERELIFKVIKVYEGCMDVVVEVFGIGCWMLNEKIVKFGFDKDVLF